MFNGQIVYKDKNDKFIRVGDRVKFKTSMYGNTYLTGKVEYSNKKCAFVVISDSNNLEFSFDLVAKNNIMLVD